MTEWQQSHADAVTVHDLVQHRPLGLTLLTSGFDDVGVSWSHSSDLDDPSPFLEPGQLLLTTGRQFATFATGAEAAADYAAYVSRLAGLGVAAIGFGTEVLRDGTPRELVEACEQAGIALVEVPYATPFIAVSKFIADRIAAEARRRLEWALAAQEAISKAVLGSGGLAAAVRSASSALDARVAVLDPDGGVLEGAVPTWLRERAAKLMRRGRRARDHGDGGGGDDGGSGCWQAQTLGRSGRLLGAVVVLRDTALSPAESSLVTMLTALTELAIEHAEDQRLGFRSIGPQLFGLLREGRVEAVREALAYHPAQLPAEPFRVVALALDELAPPVRDALERIAAGRRRRLYAVEQGEEFVLLVDQSSWAAVEAELASELATGRLRVGISEEARWDALGDAVTQASKALTGAAPGQVLEFGKLMAGTVFGLLTEHRVAELALLRLGALLPTQGGVERLHEAAVWLRHNGAWDPAARELGLHRHTLKQRIAELGRELGLSFDGFQGRAELWAMLVAVDLAER